MARRFSVAAPGDAADLPPGWRTRPPSRRRRIAFRVAALLIPVVLLLLAEGTTRLFGLGGYPPVLRRVGPVPGGTLVTTYQPGSASYFFANRGRPGLIGDSTFIDPKPPNTVRVMVFGESAAKGFPQSPAFASSAFLEAMLRDIWPDRNVEVVNLGTTAIASFPLLGIVREAVAFKPDLAVIYCGNNEFYGAYGVASLQRAGTSPTAMRFQRWLHSLGLIQLATRLATRGTPGEGKTLMEIMVGRSNIPPDDPLRAAAARSLHVHLAKMIDLCRSNGIPVIVLTPPGNERDLAPLGKADAGSLPPAQRDRVMALTERGLAAAESRPEQAIPLLEEATTLCPALAQAWFALGRAYFASSRFPEAAKAFQAALDLDPMPWRATSQCVDAIRRAAAEHSAILCDAQAIFREASPGDAIGWELMDDHVHPSLAGQALIARAVIRSMASLPAPLTVGPDAADRLATDETYFARLGDNIYSRYGAAHTARVISTIPFFVETNPGAIARFDRICKDLESRMSSAGLAAAREWQKPTTHRGAQRPIAGMAGRALITENRYAEAAELLDVARRSLSLYTSWHLEATYFYLACRERINGTLDPPERQMALDSIERGRFLLQYVRVESGNAERYIGRLYQLVGEPDRAIPYLEAARNKLTKGDLFAADQALIDAYLKTGRNADARRVAEQGADASGEYAEHYRKLLGTIPAR
jgi:tetratricopeptide (TPR) repeat protein